MPIDRIEGAAMLESVVGGKRHRRILAVLCGQKSAVTYGKAPLSPTLGSRELWKHGTMAHRRRTR